MSRTALSRVALPALAAALLLAPAVASAADWRSYTSPDQNHRKQQPSVQRSLALYIGF